MSDRTYPTLIKVVHWFPNWSHCYVTSTTGGTHVSGSYHHREEAIDVSATNQVYKDQLAAWLYRWSSHITELIHTKAGDTGGWYVKYGVRKPHGWYGTTIDRAHINHVHLAVATLSQANTLLSLVKSTYVYPSGKPAYPGTLSQGAYGPATRTLQRRLNIKGVTPKLLEDGDFGDGTRSNVIKFQKLHGLVQDGKVGLVTFNKLWS